MNLWQRGRKRNDRGSETAGPGLSPSRIDIVHRHAIVGPKSHFGDWELDSIIGAKYRSAITSMVERETRLTILVLLEGPTSESIKKGIIRRLTPHKKHVLTLISDNGKKFSGRPEISE